MKGASRMGLMAALVAGLGGSALAEAYAYRAARIDLAADLVTVRRGRRRHDRKEGGHNGKRHDDRQRRRPNMKLISKRVRRKHRLARKAA